MRNAGLSGFTPEVCCGCFVQLIGLGASTNFLLLHADKRRGSASDMRVVYLVPDRYVYCTRLSWNLLLASFLCTHCWGVVGLWYSMPLDWILGVTCAHVGTRISVGEVLGV